MSSHQHAEDRVAPRAQLPAGNFTAVLSHLGVLRFSGPDAEAFLQGQLTCDVTAIGPGSIAEGAWCSPKGRMLANFLLWRREDGYAMVLSRDLAASVHKNIAKYVLRSRVTVIDASETTVLVGAAGAEPERRLRGPSAKLPDGRLLFALPAAEAPDALRGVALADAAVWRWLDIRQGLPLVTAATQDQFVPQMANLELLGGVSFDKGCYTGQEIVARAQHLGKVKRRMFIANVSAAARPGDRLYSED